MARRSAAASQGGNRSSSRGNSQDKRNLSSRRQVPQDNRIIDDQARHDIGGVIIILLAVALFVAAILPTEGIVTSALSESLRLIFGVGAFVLPFFLAVVGITVIVRFERQRVPGRVTIGLALIFLAILGLIGLATPIQEGQYDQLFYRLMLIDHGGYIGAGLAWGGLVLFGRIITTIILIGVILVGAIIIGFSLSRLIDRVRAIREAREAEKDSVMAPPFARRREGGVDPAVLEGQMTGDLNGALLDQEMTRPLRSHDATDVSAFGAGSGSAQTRRLSQTKSDENARPLSQKAQTRKLSQDEKASLASESVDGLEGSELSQGMSQAGAAVSLMSDTSTPHPMEGFELPSMDLLKSSPRTNKDKSSVQELQDTANRLQETLSDFGINARVVDWIAGPTVTLFEVELPAGVRVSRVTALNDDLALALAAPGVRIFAPIPGTNYVGIEVPNKTRQTVVLKEVLEDAGSGPLQIAIGKDVEGNSIVTDLAKMPHLLIGGTTGSGKSVSINAMIMSILMRATPAEVRFIMIDPKRVEFTPYNGIPHLYVPVVTEPKEAASALSWGVAEMERRLKVFSKVGVRNIGQYNAKVQNGELEDEEACELPYIVIIIDELADLMMNVGKEVEFSISRIAQLARAAGIHLIVATQRPSANVVTGLIKANITNRIAFNVASGIDSRVVLDTPGAENLIGLGDLLFSKPEYPKPVRIQGCFVSESEINAVVDKLKEQAEPEYHNEILQTNLITLGASSPDGSGGGSSSDDPLLWEAADIVAQSGLGSTSNIQRRLKVGYSRAGRIMDQLEEKGIVGPANGSKPREVLVDVLELETLKAFEQNDGDDNGHNYSHDSAADLSFLEE